MADLLLLASPVLGMLVAIAGQLLLRHVAPGQSLLRSLATAAAIGLVAIVWLHLAIDGWEGRESLDRLVADLAIYAMLVYGYFHFLNLGETARRIRLIHEIGETSRGKTKQELLRLYDAREMVELRLQRLLVTGQITQEEGQLRLRGRTVLAMALAVSFLGALLGDRRLRHRAG